MLINRGGGKKKFVCEGVERSRSVPNVGLKSENEEREKEPSEEERPLDWSSLVYCW